MIYAAPSRLAQPTPEARNGPEICVICGQNARFIGGVSAPLCVFGLRHGRRCCQNPAVEPAAAAPAAARRPAPTRPDPPAQAGARRIAPPRRACTRPPADVQPVSCAAGGRVKGGGPRQEATARQCACGRPVERQVHWEITSA